MTDDILDFGINFESSAERLVGESEERAALVARKLHFNVKFLDDALGGILPNDLIVLGARTGAGKTALATMIAQKNAEQGKRVHYFALEAEPKEIERRMLYRALVQEAFARGGHLPKERFSYRAWYEGRLESFLRPLRASVEPVLRETYRGLQTYYRGAQFEANELERLFRAIQDQTDLIILDHLHYVDTDDRDENRGYKAIVKRIRDVSLCTGVPVVLIAHLRKKDRGQKMLVPDIDDFHGTSDITKIATKCILLAPAPRDPMAPNHLWTTFMTIPKDRMDATTQNYVAKVIFDVSRSAYDEGYTLGRINHDAFQALTPSELPSWAQKGDGIF